MDDQYKSRSGSGAGFHLSPFSSSYSHPYNNACTKPVKKATGKRQPSESKYTSTTQILEKNRTSSRHPTTPNPRKHSKMPKCAYCGNQSDHYSCNCGSEYASTSSVDQNPTSLNDPKPEMGVSASVAGMRSGSPSYTSTQSKHYVGSKGSGSSSSRDRR
ncbi:hypothetical protein AYO20_00447 [Fonsecaea nubica]|uniref:Uncharacterized protein n=1 Tax=Fonsecaea nubica TaxID=856822 RepID=A0A178DCW9_9EURO|nr:hypothetical protein AYO20_00447 [Fonsecaea nubica]OAL40029.1 hypothetical protein AYO20_00447 [Fonsecaea nubica]